ncbi:hypothetical protein [Mesorhizobium muleiense]|nr:hypothetical protein [Mesorhizobium muleiense]
MIEIARRACYDSTQFAEGFCFHDDVEATIARQIAAAKARRNAL